MPDFTAGGISALPTAPRTIGSPEFDEKIKHLVQEWGCENPSLIQEMIVTALKMGRDKLTVADLKLFNRSLKELRYAARVFGPYSTKQKVVVFGSARTPQDAPEAIAAEEFSRKMREHDFMTITGGGDGIMGAAQRGAGRDFSFGLNIRLPFEQRANDTIHGDSKLVNFNYFFTRKLNFVKETHAVALFPGGFGTMDEGFEVLTLMQTGKGKIIPLILIDKPGGNYWKTWFSFLADYLLKCGLVSKDDFSFFTITDSVDAAIAEILKFYSLFHSYRWVGKRMVIRIHQKLTPESVAKLNIGFKDILDSGEIVQGDALPEEKNEPDLLRLPRILLTPQQRDFARLRKLIDAINSSETAALNGTPIIQVNPAA